MRVYRSKSQLYWRAWQTAGLLAAALLINGAAQADDAQEPHQRTGLMSKEVIKQHLEQFGLSNIDVYGLDERAAVTRVRSRLEGEIVDLEVDRLHGGIRIERAPDRIRARLQNAIPAQQLLGPETTVIDNPALTEGVGVSPGRLPDTRLGAGSDPSQGQDPKLQLPDVRLPAGLQGKEAQPMDPEGEDGAPQDPARPDQILQDPKKTEKPPEEPPGRR